MTAGFGVDGMASKLTTNVVSVHGTWQQIYQLLQPMIFTQKLYQCGKDMYRKRNLKRIFTEKITGGNQYASSRIRL